RKGLTNFTYTESTFDYGTVRHLAKDYAIYSLMLGILLQDPRNRDITSFIHPRHSDGFNLRKGQTFESASRRANQVLTGIPKLVANRDVRMELPIVGMTKKQVIEACRRTCSDSLGTVGDLVRLDQSSTRVTLATRVRSWTPQVERNAPPPLPRVVPSEPVSPHVRNQLWLVRPQRGADESPRPAHRTPRART